MCGFRTGEWCGEITPSATFKKRGTDQSWYGAEKWSLLRMADLFVSPSRWEAFGIALVEAMAMGLPLVTSSQISLAPELHEAGAALMVPVSVEPLRQAIATIEADPERRRALSLRARAWAEKTCNPDRAGARFQEFYRAILDKPRMAAG
ncbi:MAG TPA: glycosyltransferase [Candidatus Paceibacterota bacterium]|nr:glycosyltransferase [Candidatus Paceibacterota bacterium]